VATPAPAIQLRGGIPRAAERTPWDFPRFVRQSVTFFEPPKLLPRLGGARAVRPGDSLGSIPLFPLDDVVMGGPAATAVLSLLCSTAAICLCRRATRAQTLFGCRVGSELRRCFIFLRRPLRR
jgi:hypothetical protein